MRLSKVVRWSGKVIDFVLTLLYHTLTWLYVVKKKWFAIKKNGGWTLLHHTIYPLKNGQWRIYHILAKFSFTSILPLVKNRPNDDDIIDLGYDKQLNLKPDTSLKQIKKNYKI